MVPAQPHNMWRATQASVEADIEDIFTEAFADNLVPD
jgi:hypothetical protein